MAIVEQWLSQRYSLGKDGGTGTRVFICDPDEALQCVKYGSSFPGVTRLKAYNVTVDPYVPKDADTRGNKPAKIVKVTVDYAVKKSIGDENSMQISGSGKVLETGIGRQWLSDGKVNTQPQAVFYSTLTLNITRRVTTVPLAQLCNAVNKVNWSTVMGFSKETLLFEGFDIQDQYDSEYDTWFYNLTLRFQWQSVSWNVVWRAGEQQTDSDGSLLYDDNGNPIFSSTGQWDRLYPDLYDWTDLGVLLGYSPSIPEGRKPTPTDRPVHASSAGLGGDYATTVKSVKAF